MPYVHRTVVCGDTIEHRKMYSSRVHSKEVKPRKRSSEKKETSKCQERINERVAEEHLRWLINCNYRYGDYHMVLHYWDKEITLEQAERDRAAFLRELRKAYTKAGKRLKYIAVLETKHMTNVHHHILLPRFDAQIIAAAWTKVTNGAGSISFQMLDDRKNHAKLASYLIKESRSTMRRYREQGIRRRRYTCSAGMAKPEIRYQVAKAETWRKEPKARRGMHLYRFDDGAEYKSGWHELSGWPWQEYYEIKDTA